MKRYLVHLICLMGIMALCVNQWGFSKTSSGSWGVLADDNQYWFPLGKGLNHRCYAVAVKDHDLYAGGQFTTAGDIAVNYIAKWNGTTWSSLGSGTNGIVRSIAVNGSSIYAGGEFTQVDGSNIGYIAKWNGGNWLNLGIGVNDVVRAIAVDGNDIYVGGDFESAGGLSANRIARWDGVNWSVMDDGANNSVRAIAIDGNDVYVGGLFTVVGGVTVNYIAKWNGSHWSALDGGLDGPVYSIHIHEDEIYVGGHFTEAGGNPALNLAKWDGLEWSEVGDGIPGDGTDVNALVMCGGNLYVGGEFSQVGGVYADNLAVWDGENWFALGSGANLDVHSLALSNDFLYVGGAFWIAGGKQCSNVCRWRYTRSYTGFDQLTADPTVVDGGLSIGCAWGDYDNDNDLDLFVPNGGTIDASNFLYTNNGNGTFTRVSSGPVVSDGGASWAGSWGDYDNDGDLDLFVANKDENNFLYQNNGNGTFTSVTAGDIVTEGGASQGCSWADYNKDGNLDLFVANTDGENNFLYTNNGDGTFSKVTSGAVVLDGGHSASGTWTDYNLDGNLDLFVANLEDEDNFLYKNNGDGSFTRVQAGSIVNNGGNSWGGSWGDYNNDAYPDLFVANSEGVNFLYKNNGDETFTQIMSSPVTTDIYNTRSSSWEDADNDGDFDLFISNHDENSYIYINDGEGDFSKFYTESAASRGAAWCDYDHDGDLDLYGAVDGEDNYLYTNNLSNDNHWLNVKCVGTLSNMSAVGARVTIKAIINGQATWQTRSISSQTGFGGQNSLNAEFGLGDAVLADYMRIEWPNGIVWDTTDVVANQFLVIQERQLNPQFTEVADQFGLDDNRQASGAMWFDYDSDGDLDLLVSGNYSTDLSRLFRNDGNQFVDVAESVGFGPGNPSSLYHISVGDYDNDDDPDLLMYAGGYGLFRNDIENLGLFTDVGGYYPGGTFVDYDNDGYLDIYVTNLDGANQLYHNQHDASFVEIEGALGLGDTGYSRTAIWGDYDSDGDMDLYVVNGQNQRSSLYRNDVSSTGLFTDVTDVLGVGNASEGYGNGACWGDYDNDGDLDLYLITLSENRLFRNDLNTLGQFTEVGRQLEVAGDDESTDARWADYDNDGDLDLYVVNIGTNRLYRNNVPQGIGFLETDEMANQESFYSGGSWGDYDQDGDLDFYLATPGTNRLYRNNNEHYNWLHIEAVGVISNRTAIGARISVTVNGLTQVRYVETTSGFGSQNSLPVEFGLGLDDFVDMIQILWPSGVVWDTTNVAANQYMVILEPSSYPDGSGGIAGTVYRNDGSTAISGTRVEVRSADNDLITSTLTDESGQYLVPDIAVGSYYVIANGFIYASQSYEYFSEYYDDAPDKSQAALVEVRNGLTSSNIDFTLDRQIQLTISVDPNAYPFKADGMSYSETQIFIWRDASTHTLGVEEYHENAIDGRAYFDRWSHGAERQHDFIVPDENTSLTAFYVDQYELTVTSQYGDPTDSGWYLAFESVQLAVEEFVIDYVSVSGESDSIRHQFVAWEGVGNGSYSGTENSIYITMDDNITETALWKDQHPLTLVYDPDMGTVTVDPEADWHDKNSVVKLKAIPQEEYLFDGWGGSISGITDSISFLMDTSKVVYPTFRLINKAPYLAIPDTSFAEDDTLFLSTASLMTWISDSTDSYETLEITLPDTSDHIQIAWDTSGVSVWADTDWNGTGWLVVHVEDPEGATDSDSVFFTIEPVNDPPGVFELVSPEDEYQYTNEAEPFTFTWNSSNNVDADNGDLIQYVFYFGPSGSTLDSITVVSDTSFTHNQGSKLENGNYQWKVLAVDNDGEGRWSTSEWIVEIAFESKVAETSSIPKKFALYQNFPNPFNPSTMISYDLPKSSQVTLTIYSITGHEVAILVDKNQKPGSYQVEWDGCNRQGLSVASGIYIYQIKAKQFTKTRKMMYIR